LALSSTAQSLLRDATRTWNAGDRQPIGLSYSFATQAGPDAQQNGSKVTPFTEAQQASVRLALKAWDDVSGIHFVEAPDAADGAGIALRFSIASGIGGAFSVSSPAQGGDISLQESYSRSDMAPGSEAFGALLLSIGFALGLDSADSGRFGETVMANASLTQPPAASLRSADIEAIQHTYGTQQAEDALNLRWSWDNNFHGLRQDGDDNGQVLRGSRERDIIVGHGGNDVIDGGAGNDVLAAGSGANTVTGGDGVDTLLTGLFRQQTTLGGLQMTVDRYSSSGTQPTVQGTLSGPGETTAFSRIEVLAFADGRLVFDEADPAAQVMRLYQAALGRQPDPLGREDWTAKLQQGVPLFKLAEGFLGSEEFLARFGRPDDAGFITRAYQQALGRDPDAAGLDFWQAKLAGGMSRAEMLVGFSESQENHALTKPLLQQGVWDVDNQMAGIARLYQAVLGRAPDAQGLGFWDQKADAGMTTAQMANLFAQSAEFNARFPGATDAAFVQMVYQNTLGRPGEVAGESFWLDKLAHGMTRGEVVAGFAESTEFLLRSADLTDHGIVFG
jgi:hypothetical protein